MLSIDLKNIRFGISFSFFALIGIIFILEQASVEKILLILICCCMHETGHIIMMFLCNIPPKSIILYGGGIKIQHDKSKLIAEWQDALILSSGCIVNLITVGAIIFLKHELTFFASANLFLGLFNLMPVKYFDGGRILSIALKDSRAVRLIRVGFILAFGYIIAAMFFNGFFSVSLILTFIYIVTSEFFT